MSRKEITLYKICLENIAHMLKKTVWHIDYEFSGSGDNPFSSLPSSIIDELIAHVARLSVLSPLKKTDLYHLITTGQVRNFKLEDIQMSSDDLLFILMQLSAKCRNLSSIKLINIYCIGSFVDSTSLRNKNMMSNALDCVLTMSPRLELVESCKHFSLKALRNAERLKQLKINFVPQTPIHDFLEEVDGHFWPNDSLQVLEVFEDLRHPFSYLEIAVILKYCKKLVEINCDISKSLEYLHAKELFTGTLDTQYKLEKCHLGSIYLSSQDAAVSKDSIYIASITCPFLKEIDVLIRDEEAIFALGDFQNLESLLLQWESMICGNFLLGTQILLEKIGFNLKILHIVHFSNVDFSIIGMCCPNLKELHIEYISERSHHEFTAANFQNLTNLHIESIEESYCLSVTLVGLLSNCTSLKILTLLSAEGLTDSTLEEILVKNKLSELKEARIHNCSVSSVGIQDLASNLTSLEYLEISSMLITFETIVSVVHEINPKVILNCASYD